MTKLSPWNSGSVSPVHIGWYQVKGEVLDGFYGNGKGFDAWRFWNGKKWYWAWKDAVLLTDAAVWECDKWRGIVK